MAQLEEEIPWGNPPSPWLRRYGGVQDPVLRREGRSGLAPKFPDLPPFGVDVDYNAPALLEPSGEELDSLLWDEATQLIENKGWKSWQMGAFAEGDSWEDYTDPIKVDETKWHPLFKKDRWYDFQVPLVPGDPAKGIMSIDNQLVWEDMSVVIELANQLFGMLANDGFFDTILAGVPFSQVQYVKKSKAYTDVDREPKCARRANIMEEERNNVHDRALEQLFLLAPLIVITWYQDRSAQGIRIPQSPLPPEARPWPPWGKTQLVEGQDNKFIIYIRLAASILRSISQCDDKTQDGRTEKRLLIVRYATTLMHEMSHAVFMAHSLTEDAAANNAAIEAKKAEDAKFAAGVKTAQEVRAAKDAIDSDLSSGLIGGFEPAIEDDHVVELGYAAEQALFGGTVNLTPFSGSRLCSCMHTFNSTYQLYLCQFPADASRFMTMTNFWDAESRWKFPRVDVMHVMAASHATHLLSQTYWEKCCHGSMGIAALRPLKVFSSACHMPSESWALRHFCNEFDQDDDQSTEAKRLIGQFAGIRREDDIMGRHQLVFERLSARQELWERMRPWYQVERRRWTRTPYGNHFLRLNLRSFNHAVEIKDERQAVTKLNEANFYMRNLPPYRMHDDVRSYYAVVAAAMTATLPWRITPETVVVEPDIKAWKVPNLYQPSIESRKWQAQPDWQPYSFAFKSEVECQNRVIRWGRGTTIPSAIRVKSPQEGRIVILGKATAALKRMKQDKRIQDDVYKVTDMQLTRLINEVNGREMNYTGFLTSFYLILPTYTYDQQMPALALPPVPVPDAQPSAQRLIPGQAGGFQNPSNAQGGANAFMVRVVEQQDLTKKYWSAGEVGDHGGDNGEERWVLVDNDELGGYDVFSISALPPRLARNVQHVLQVDFEYGVRVTDHGVAAQIRALQGTFRGRLLVPRTKEEIAENQGQYGGSKWVLAGPYIYDITHFSAKDDDERELLWSAPYGDVLYLVMTTQGPERDIDLDDLQRRLYPFRCATLRRAPISKNDSALWRPYTLREVNLHVFPQIRALTSVDGWVYEITEFADTSPLGRQKVLSLAGREVGKHIRSSSTPSWTERFLRDVAPYRVGWVVPERAHARLTRHEIQLRDCIYSFAVLVQSPKTKEDAHLGQALSSLGGMDATDELAHHHELRQLTERQELVVAMVYSEPTFEIGQEDLEAHGSVNKDGAEELDQEEEKYDLDGSTWARIGDVVYDVSNLVDYGDDTTRARVLAFAGRAITDAALIHDIQRCGVARAIGKFKPGVKPKWSKMAKPQGEFGLELPPEENLAEDGPGFECGCGLDRHLLQPKDVEHYFMHEYKLPPVDAEHLAAFSHVGVDDLKEGKRMRFRLV